MHCNLILNTISKSISDVYTYEIPKEFEYVEIGDRVIVGFGNSDRYIDALVYSIQEESPYENTKPILDVLPKKYSLSKTQMLLLDSIRSRYASTYNYAFLSVLPSVQNLIITPKYLFRESGYNKIAGEGHEYSKQEIIKILGHKTLEDFLKSKKVVRTFSYELRSHSKFEEIAYCNFDNLDLEAFGIKKNAIKQIRMLEHIHDTKVQNLSEFMKATSATRADIRRLVEKDLIIVKKQLQEISPAKYEIKAKNIMGFALSEEQANILEEYISQKENSQVFRALVQGVTGSGKTRLYMELAKKVIESGKQVLVLLPEISLTPQLIGVFRENISKRICVIHNKVSDAEKSTHFENIKNSAVDIVIGARSAIFAPFSDLGLIVIDEAHENSYISETTPKYDIRELAFDLSMKAKVDLIYGSATPPLQLLHLTDDFLQKFVMKNRIGNARFPEIGLVDMKNALSHDRELLVSDYLIRSMQEVFSKGEQVILFYNRRGYANFLLCSHCGHVEKCINCDISLKVHKRGDVLNCHYCGYSRKNEHRCSKCGEKYEARDLFGAGIDKYLEFFKKKFPRQRFAQIDSQSVSTQAKLMQQLEEFKNGNVDCLIGTQILAKGLDFPNVTLIGVLDADQLVNMPDYMANERAFQLMMQVSGRAGRHEKKGKVIIQSFNSELDLFEWIRNHDFEGFIHSEDEMRKLLSYPPYSKLYMIGINSEDEGIVKEDIMRVYKMLNNIFAHLGLQTVLFKPSTFYYAKLKNRYIYNIILKGPKEEYSKVVNVLYQVISVDKYKLIDKNSHVFLDFNPIFL